MQIKICNLKCSAFCGILRLYCIVAFICCYRPFVGFKFMHFLTFLCYNLQLIKKCMLKLRKMRVIVKPVITYIEFRDKPGRETVTAKCWENMVKTIMNCILWLCSLAKWSCGWLRCIELLRTCGDCDCGLMLDVAAPAAAVL